MPSRLEDSEDLLEAVQRPLKNRELPELTVVSVGGRVLKRTRRRIDPRTNRFQHDPDFRIRFWAYVRKTDKCWEWQGAILSTGYGQFSHKKQRISAHRLAYILEYGQIPEGLLVCHKCNNRSCVRPSHLYAGTAKQNFADAIKAGAIRFGERHHSSKIDWNQAATIRELAANGVSQRKIAKQFNIAQTSVGAIIRHETWTRPR